MQELTFNTTNKTVVVKPGLVGIDLYSYNNVATVRITEFYYEVMQEENGKKYPVFRAPISNTNMIIEK